MINLLKPKWYDLTILKPLPVVHERNRQLFYALAWVAKTGYCFFLAACVGGRMKEKELMGKLLEKYGITKIYIGHVKYAPNGALRHECAVHVEYRDGRTICVTDDKVSDVDIEIDEKGIIHPPGASILRDPGRQKG